MKDLHGSDSDDFSDDSDPSYEADDGATSTDEEVSDLESEDFLNELEELEGEDFVFEILESDTSDDEFKTTRNGVRECNMKLLRITKELQEQVA